jgi:hypothetical protein
LSNYDIISKNDIIPENKKQIINSTRKKLSYANNANLDIVGKNEKQGPDFEANTNKFKPGNDYNYK